MLYGAHTIVQSNTIMYFLPCISTIFKLQYIYLSDPNAAVYLTMLQMPPKKQGSCLLEHRISLFLKNPQHLLRRPLPAHRQLQLQSCVSHLERSGRQLPPRCDSDVDALLSDRKSQKDSPLARSHSSVNTSSIEARNAASLEHQLPVQSTNIISTDDPCG